MSPFEKIVTKMLEVHKAKNHDYSREGAFGNFRESESIGIPAWKGAFVRLQDKYTRCCNLIRRDGEAMVLDEKLEDTLLDMANYSVIVLCLLQDEVNKADQCGDVVTKSIIQAWEGLLNDIQQEKQSKNHATTCN